MLLSIVVLSYNRPEQIKRILDNLEGAKSGDFEIVIKDDNSPLKEEIRRTVLHYKSILNVKLRLHENDHNLGYDRNLIDSFDIVSSRYVFLLSDDDYVAGNKIADLLQVLAREEYDVYFTPYNNGSILSRTKFTNNTANEFAHIIYNSILFSGLVFRRERVLSLNKDMGFLSSCIYSQVYLSSVIIFHSGAYGFLPTDILFLGGDGENYFGKNESAENRELLSNRKHIAANLNYQSFLLRVVKAISKETNEKVYTDFSDEYFKRLISYGLKARSTGILNYIDFYMAYLKSKLSFYPSAAFFFTLFFFLHKDISRWLNDVATRRLKKSG